MNYQSGLDQLFDAIKAGRGAEKVTYRQQFNTYMFSHNLATDIEFKAAVHRLQVTRKSGSGWFSRSHLITTNGTIKDTWVFWSTVIKFMEANA